MLTPASVPQAERGFLGIVGGLGPLASAELVRSIYRYQTPAREQEAPRCLLLSDPTCPDRTEAIAGGREHLLVEYLTRSVEDLLALGAAKVVVACFTIHHVLPRLPEAARSRVLSLVELAITEILASDRRVLQLSSSGTRAAALLEGDPRWPAVADRVVQPDAGDQEEIHRWLYRLKQGDSGEAIVDRLRAMAAKSGVGCVLFGCTELHLLHPLLAADPGAGLAVIDPLLTVARDLPRLLAR